jgi:hypothetical protein
MLNADGIYIFENPTFDTVHDACFALGVDTGNCYAVVYVRDIDGWGFDLFCLGCKSDKLIGRSDFSFRTKRETIEWLEPQVPKVRVCQ